MEEQPAQQPETSAQDDNQSTVHDLLVWKSFSRPPFTLGKEEFTTAVSVCFLLSIILSFFKEFFLIGFIWAALLLVMALSKRPPEEVEHKITTEGITSMGRVHLWEELGAFWFTHRGKYPLMHVTQLGNIFGTVIIVLPIGSPTEEQVRDTVAQFIPFIETVEKSRMDRMTDWLVAKLSLNKDR